MFESDWIAQHLNGSAASNLILSVDKVADAGLERAQSSALTAVTRLISLALAVVSLIALAGVSALIYCFKSAQRIFVQRTSGLCWASIFRARLLVDVATCCIVTIGITAFEPKMVWLGIVFSLTYLLISSTLHMASGKFVFRRILNRNL